MTHFKNWLHGKGVFLIFVFFLAIFPFTNKSQAKDIPHTFHTLTVDDGLSDNLIFSLCKDSTGFIWIGTQLGLNRFDGINIKKYEQPGSELITYICEANNIELLLGTESGLKRFNRKNGAVSDIILDSRRVVVKTILKIEKDKFLIGAEQGLYFLDGENVRKITFENGISSSNNISSIIQGDDYTFWATSQNGLCFLDLKNNVKKVFRANLGHVDYNYMSCLTRIDSTIWIGTSGKGVLIFNCNTASFHNYFPALGNNYIMNITSDKENLYIGTNGGGLKVYSLKSNSISTISNTSDNPNSISSNSIYSFLLVGSTFWVGTYKHGLSYNFNISDNFQTFSTPYFKSSNYNVRSFWIDEKGNKLIGTRSGLYFVSENGHLLKKFMTFDSSILTSDIILSVFPFENQLLIGTFGGGIYVFNPNTLTLNRFNNEPDFIDGCIFNFITDKDNCLWIATNKGVYMFDTASDKLKKYDVANSRLSDNNIYYLMNDSKNRIWIGTNDGLCVLDKFTDIIRSDVFPKEYSQVLKLVNYVYEDKSGNLWICTKKGVLQIDESLTNVKYYSEGLFNNIFVNVTEYGDDLWFATSVGIIKFNAQNNVTLLYNVADGMRGCDFNNVVQKTDDNRIWWANEKGLLYCNPDKFVYSNRNTSPVITAFYVNQKEFLGSNNEYISAEYLNDITLSSSDNNIGFHFSLLSYSLPKSEIYEYMLVGHDKTWQKQIGNDEVYYTNLQSGKYEFIIKDYNNPDYQKKINIIIQRSYKSVIWGVVIVILFIVIIFVFTIIIKKLKEQIKKKRIFPTSSATGADDKVKYVNKNVPKSKIEQIKENLLAYMDEGKPYLNANLKVADVAKAVNCSVPELSHVLNVDLGTNFSDFVNTYRINEFKLILNKDILLKLTLKTLSEQCGFKSRTTFYRAFNKDTGMSPLEYCKKLGFASVKEE